MYSAPGQYLITNKDYVIYRSNDFDIFQIWITFAFVMLLIGCCLWFLSKRETLLAKVTLLLYQIDSFLRFWYLTTTHVITQIKKLKHPFFCLISQDKQYFAISILIVYLCLSMAYFTQVAVFEATHLKKLKFAPLLKFYCFN